MRNLIALLLCWPLWVGAATWYVTPTGAGAEDGTSLANAFAGFADAWATAGDIEAGDTLCVSGTFTGAADAQISTMMLRILDSGTSGNLITIDGDCDGDGVYATLDGNGEVNIGIAADVATGQAEYINVRRLNVTGFIIKGLRGWNNASTDITNDAYQTWEYNNITEIGDGGSGDNCVDLRGRYVTFRYNTVSGCDDEAVYQNGKYFSATYNTIIDFSRDTTDGDGIQVIGEGDGYEIAYNTITHTKDTKQGIIISSLTDTGAGGKVTDNVIAGVDGGTVGNCIYAAGDGALVARNYCTGFKAGIILENSANATNMTITGNIVSGCSDSGIVASASSATGNQIVGNSVEGCAIGIETRDTDVIGITNNLVMGNSGCGIELEDAGQSESYNATYGNGTAVCRDGVGITAGTGAVTSDPLLIGGPNPTTAEGFKLKSTSPLIDAATCVYTTGCVPYDYGGRRARVPADIGAWQRN